MSRLYETIRFGHSVSNAEKLGMIIKWLVTHHLTDVAFERENASPIARLRMEDMSGEEFFTTVLNGEFRSDFLNQEGRDFVEKYFLEGLFDNDYAEAKEDGTEAMDLLYPRIAVKISEAHKKLAEASTLKKKLAKVLDFPTRFIGKT